MAKTLRVGLAQINTTVGDLEGNVRKALEYVERGRELGVDIVSFPELTVTGYPPEDLLLRASFVKHNVEALRSLVEGCRGITVVVGFADLVGSDVFNAAALINDGSLADVYHKQRLPNYGVFDEVRYFRAGAEFPVYEIAGIPVGGDNLQENLFPRAPPHPPPQTGARA